MSYIRDNGAMNAVISTDVDDLEGLKKQLFLGRRRLVSANDFGSYHAREFRRSVP